MTKLESQKKKDLSRYGKNITIRNKNKKKRQKKCPYTNQDIEKRKLLRFKYDREKEKGKEENSRRFKKKKLFKNAKTKIINFDEMNLLQISKKEIFRNTSMKEDIKEEARKQEEEK